jgi:peptide/histidine transporter 3/4
VEEVKLLACVMPVWVTTLVFMVTVQQVSVVFLKQGLTMDLHMGPHFQIPAASLELSCTITALLLIPLYDALFVPFIRRRVTGNERGLSLLQRIGVGLVISVVGMAVAAIVETKRLKVIRDNRLQTTTAALPMSVFWLTPQYSIMGVAQVIKKIKIKNKKNHHILHPGALNIMHACLPAFLPSFCDNQFMLFIMA